MSRAFLNHSVGRWLFVKTFTKDLFKQHFQHSPEASPSELRRAATFIEDKHGLLCSWLKTLYVGITRARKRVPWLPLKTGNFLRVLAHNLLSQPFDVKVFWKAWDSVESQRFGSWKVKIQDKLWWVASLIRWAVPTKSTLNFLGHFYLVEEGCIALKHNHQHVGESSRFGEIRDDIGSE